MGDTTPTAEELIIKQYGDIWERRSDIQKSKISKKRYIELFGLERIDGCEPNTKDLMIEFAKLHVKKALETAYKNAELVEQQDGMEQICFMGDDMGYAWVLDKESVLNAYSLSNIK